MRAVKISKFNLKIFSIISGVLIWVYVLQAERLEIEKNVNLQFIAPDDLVLSEKVPQEVVVTLEGPRAFVLSALTKDDFLIINLDKELKQKVGRNILKIDASFFKLPLGVKVKHLSPQKIPIILEKKSYKVVPVKPVFQSLRRSKTIEIIQSQMSPSELKISGPRSLIAKISELTTKVIDSDGLLGLSEIPVELNLPDTRVQVEDFRELKMKFELKIPEPNLVLRNLPIRIFSKNPNAQAKVKNATLKLFVPDRFKKSLEFSSRVQVWVDVPQMQTGNLNLPLKTFTPPGTHLLEVSPKSILVNVQ